MIYTEFRVLFCGENTIKKVELRGPMTEGHRAIPTCPMGHYAPVYIKRKLIIKICESNRYFNHLPDSSNRYNLVP